jgi:hypothetical protein
MYLKIKSKLAKERAVMIKEGMPTLKLQKVLHQIFAWYSDFDLETAYNDMEMDDLRISEIMASRLWYRCGMKLSTLVDIVTTRICRNVNFQDFFGLIRKIIAEDDSNYNRTRSLNILPTLNFEVCLEFYNSH